MKKKMFRSVSLLLLLAFLFSGYINLKARGQELSVERPETVSKFTILLIGQDQREGVPGKRSDSMILCTFCPGEKKLILTSVLRDLYVKIPQYGYERINAAYALGGWDLLDKTLQENFEIQVDGNMEVDFEKFIEIVDVLGGVTLQLREDEAREINQELSEERLKPGIQTMNGAETLSYARIRCLDPDGDFSRTDRQRKVMEALLQQVRDLKFSEYLPLLKKLLPAVSTDLNTFELLTYGKQILPMLGEIQVESQRIPGPACCRDEVIRGMAVLVPDIPAVKKQIENILAP